VVGAGFGMTGFTYHDAESTLRATWHLPRLAGPEYPGTVGTMRNSARDPPRRRAGRRRGGPARHDGAGARRPAGLSSGSSARYDLVVGADGIRSRVRELAFDGAPGPDYTGVVVWRADRPPAGGRSLPPLQRAARDVRAVPGLARPDAHVRGGAAGRFGNVAADDEPALMRALLAGFGGFAGDMRDRITDAGQVVRCPVEAILVPPPWHDARTALIGDAVQRTAADAGDRRGDHARGRGRARGDARRGRRRARQHGRVHPPGLGALPARGRGSVARTRGITEPTPGFDVAAFERRVRGELAKPY
jgi:hypothetical protein